MYVSILNDLNYNEIFFHVLSSAVSCLNNIKYKKIDNDVKIDDKNDIYNKLSAIDSNDFLYCLKLILVKFVLFKIANCAGDRENI